MLLWLRAAVLCTCWLDQPMSCLDAQVGVSHWWNWLMYCTYNHPLCRCTEALIYNSSCCVGEEALCSRMKGIKPLFAGFLSRWFIFNVSGDLTSNWNASDRRVSLFFCLSLLAINKWERNRVFICVYQATHSVYSWGSAMPVLRWTFKIHKTQQQIHRRQHKHKVNNTHVH